MSFSFDRELMVVHIRFRYPPGRKGVGRHVTLSSQTEREAERIWAGVEETLDDLRRGKLVMPAGLDDDAIKKFIISSGKILPPSPGDPARFVVRTLGELFAYYERELTTGAKGAGTLETERVHVRHLLGFFSGDLPLDRLNQLAVQNYVNQRGKAGISPVTISKELTTLSTIQGWASGLGISGPSEWAKESLTLPKGRQKLAFLTLEQIERRIKRGNLSQDEQSALWESLWLDTAQTLEVLEVVRGAEVEPVVYPMFAAAAYTGARRGELLRSEKEDWNFEGGQVAIRQSKSDKSKAFTVRHAPIHPALASIILEWFGMNGSRMAFAREGGEPINERLASRFFRKALRHSKWEALRGGHVFRHSLASNMASRGVDQRQIDAILGHSTEEMSRRYRHLLPADQASAIASVFPT